MRILLVSSLIASLVVADTATSDDSTSNWVLQAVANSTDQSKQSKLNLNPSGDVSTVDCTTMNNKAGVCVLYYQCNTTTKTIINDGAGLLDVRTNNCPHYLEVCCMENDIQKTQPIGTSNEENDPDFDKAPNANKDQFNILDSSTSTTTTPKPLVDESKKTNIPECGWNNPGVSPFTFRDLDAGKNDPYALFGDFPWMVAVLKKSGNSSVWSKEDYLGGGTLIHPSVVMTAAHKLTIGKKNYEAHELKCRAGEWDTQTELELYKHQERDVKKYIKHEEYYRTSLFNDIALLILKTPIQLKGAPHIGIGCLSPSLPPPGRDCYSMGWGRNDPKDKKKYAVILKKVRLRMVEHDTCQQMLRDNSRLGQIFILDKSLTCASGSAGEDSCRGDGGSPLVCTVSDDQGETRFAVYGMVAYGVSGKCFDPSVPGVYVNTAHLKSWIDTTMQQEGFDTRYYAI